MFMILILIWDTVICDTAETTPFQLKQSKRKLGPCHVGYYKRTGSVLIRYYQCRKSHRWIIFSPQRTLLYIYLFDTPPPPLLLYKDTIQEKFTLTQYYGNLDKLYEWKAKLSYRLLKAHRTSTCKIRPILQALWIQTPLQGEKAWYSVHSNIFFIVCEGFSKCPAVTLAFGCITERVQNKSVIVTYHHRFSKWINEMK